MLVTLWIYHTRRYNNKKTPLARRHFFSFVLKFNHNTAWQAVCFLHQISWGCREVGLGRGVKVRCDAMGPHLWNWNFEESSSSIWNKEGPSKGEQHCTLGWEGSVEVHFFFLRDELDLFLCFLICSCVHSQSSPVKGGQDTIAVEQRGGGGKWEMKMRAEVISSHLYIGQLCA